MDDMLFKPDLDIQKKLFELYPDRNAREISKNKEIYKEVKKRAKINRISEKEYLYKLGFEYGRRDWGVEVNESNVYEYLIKLYPDKMIPGKADILHKSSKVYSFIRLYCDKMNIDKNEYLEKMGFEIIRGIKNLDNEIDEEPNISSSFIYNPLSKWNKYNIDAIIKLRDEYGCKLADLSSIIGVTKQAIASQIERKKYHSYFIGNEENIEGEVTKKIIELIDNYEVEFCDDYMSIKVFWSNKGNGIAILYKYRGDIKCVFNIPDAIRDKLKEKLYWKLNKNDIQLLRMINSSKDIIEKECWDGSQTKIVIEDKEIKKLANSNKRIYKMDIEDYYKYIGINYYTNKDKIIDRLYDVMNDSLDKNGIVKIDTSKKSKYTRFYRDLKEINSTIDEMAKMFGFRYKRQVNKEDIGEKYKQIIKERYIVYENKVYINSQDKFYLSIIATSYKKGKSIDAYLKELGFDRLKRENLPEEYVEYNWRKNDKGDYNIILEKAKIILCQIANKDKEVYIDSNLYEYSALWKYAYLLNMNLNQLIRKLNYKRIYKNESIARHILDKEVLDIETIENAQRLELLKQLENLDHTFKTKNSKSKEIVDRNKKLPVILKRLYLHKCQLCSNEKSLPPIEMNNGEEYVEVHHIKKLSEGININDESAEELDSYTNCVVVCCYHHKYLHLHHGGFRNIAEINGKLYFVNDYGEKIEIITNYHLKPTMKLD